MSFVVHVPSNQNQAYYGDTNKVYFMMNFISKVAYFLL